MIGTCEVDFTHWLSIYYSQNKPAQAAVKITFKSGPRRALKNLKRTIRNSKYRRDLTQVGLLIEIKFH